MKLRFWGVRGSLPTPVSDNLGFGGNTPCLQVVSSNGDQFIFDAGTGIRALGQLLVSEACLHSNLFLSHFHWDHIQGIPYFAPLYRPEATIRIHTTAPVEKAEEAMRRLMGGPHFPFPWDDTESRKGFVEMTSAPVAYADVSVAAFPLNHPQGASGFRIRTDRALVVYATDTEHGDEHFDQILLTNCAHADLLIYDTQYTPEAYDAYKGWGHSTWKAAVECAAEAQVKRLVLFHHDPANNDAVVRETLASARTHFPRTDAAYEGLTYEW